MLTVFASNKSQSYYKLVLKDPRDSNAALPPSVCKMKALTDAMPSVVDYVQPSPRKPLARGVDGDSGDEETLANILKRLGPARTRPDEEADALLDGSSGESSKSKAESMDGPLPIADAIDGSDDDGLEPWPDSIEGVKLGFPPPFVWAPTY